MKDQVMYQGDIGLRLVNALPDGATKVAAKDGHYVIAWGEATNHAHAVVATPEVELYERNGVLYLKCDAPTALLHGPLHGGKGDHGTQTLAPGVHEVIRQRTYDYVAHAPRRVID